MKNYQPRRKPTYTISAVNANGSSQFPRPEILPQAGDVLMAEKLFRTKAGLVYQVGTRLRLIERTQDAPFGMLSSLGNWVVECPFQVSVWTNIELMIAEGTLSYDKGPETTKATQEREDIVAKVRTSLSEDEWNALKLQLIGEGK